jgi:predicted HicB family RNase H-like nuclease
MNNKTIHIDADLHKKLKLDAIKNNISLRELVEIKLKTPVGSVVELPVKK